MAEIPLGNRNHREWQRNDKEHSSRRCWLLSFPLGRTARSGEQLGGTQRGTLGTRQPSSLPGSRAGWGFPHAAPANLPGGGCGRGTGGTWAAAGARGGSFIPRGALWRELPAATRGPNGARARAGPRPGRAGEVSAAPGGVRGGWPAVRGGCGLGCAAPSPSPLGGK